ncbi:response regulator transcription factor [bacterium]|nr:response regulator transcription factor [bacterium]
MVRQQKTQLLLADDDELILQYAADYFKKKGYRVFTENNGYDALMTMQIKSPDLAIIDVMMPGMDGISTLQKAKQDPRIADIPIIIISAKNQQENIVSGLNHGAHDYIVKPFDIDELSARVAGILKREKKEALQQ